MVIAAAEHHHGGGGRRRRRSSCHNQRRGESERGLSRDCGDPAAESSSSMPTCHKNERRLVKDAEHSLSQVGTFSPIATMNVMCCVYVRRTRKRT